MIWLAAAWATTLAEGEALRAQGDLRAATEVFEELTRVTPTAAAWSQLAVTRSWAGDLKGAIEAYEQALALDPEDVSLVVGQARIQGWRGRRALAERSLVQLPGGEAQLALARVQLARLALRRARTTLGTLPSTEEVQQLQDQVDAAKRTRVSLAAGWTSTHAGRIEGSLAHRVSGTLTVQGAAGWGAALSDPLAGGGYGTLGTTWADRGWWITPSATLDGAGIWASGDVARRLGPCVPALGASVGPAGVRGRVGGQCTSKILAVDARVFASTTTQALVVDVSTLGRWKPHVGGVVMNGPFGVQGTAGIARDGERLLIGLDVSQGAGALKGTGVAVRAELRH